MGGYEIQHLSYLTFEGMEADATDPATGNKIKAPNSFSLLQRDFASLTAIFAKLGVANINSNLATGIRTIIILIMVGVLY